MLFRLERFLKLKTKEKDLECFKFQERLELSRFLKDFCQFFELKVAVIRFFAIFKAF